MTQLRVVAANEACGLVGADGEVATTEEITAVDLG
jgi:hypothetical protein